MSYEQERERRRQRQRQNEANIPIFVDNTATPAGPRINQNNSFVLQPIENNQQAQAIGRYDHNAVLPFAVQAWRRENTLPTDPTQAAVYYAMDPYAYSRASRTYHEPQGQPVVVDTLAWGYEAAGQWHVGWFGDALAQRQQRPFPDTTPMWSRGTLQALDRQYRDANMAYTGLVWPTPAIGMTEHLPTIRAVERSGIYVQDVDRNGYVMWVWQGTQ
ncbi:hypothetical protein CEP52_017596 [Fusarium oligoseptatum]|uniref:Uncharacterized protein n=1 Tax=Fusarium oligoseptatum TaxID=2604345 RepID=A0A428RMT1_9HYPO|nr:hypothetical protein CEP52_017596 [Fusarium oligoseptatum]